MANLPSRMASIKNAEGGDAGGSATATSNGPANEVLVPNKSTLVEEDVGIGTGSPSLASRGTESGSSATRVGINGRDYTRDRTMSPPLGSASSAGGGDRNGGGNLAGMTSPISTTSSSFGPNGISKLVNGDGPRSGKGESEYFDKISLGRASEASSIGTRFLGNYASGAPSASGNEGGRRSVSVLSSPSLFRVTQSDYMVRENQWEDEEMEKMRSDYEYKIATMQKKITNLENDLADVREEARSKEADAERARDLEDDLKNLRKVSIGSFSSARFVGRRV